jgi:hypothetical protein
LKGGQVLHVFVQILCLDVFHFWAISLGQPTNQPGSAQRSIMRLPRPALSWRRFPKKAITKSVSEKHTLRAVDHSTIGGLPVDRPFLKKI